MPGNSDATNVLIPVEAPGLPSSITIDSSFPSSGDNADGEFESDPTSTPEGASDSFMDANSVPLDSSDGVLTGSDSSFQTADTSPSNADDSNSASDLASAADLRSSPSSTNPFRKAGSFLDAEQVVGPKPSSLISSSNVSTVGQSLGHWPLDEPTDTSGWGGPLTPGVSRSPSFKGMGSIMGSTHDNAGKAGLPRSDGDGGRVAVSVRLHSLSHLSAFRLTRSLVSLRLLIHWSRPVSSRPSTPPA